jgi:hypothetical protein
LSGAGSRGGTGVDSVDSGSEASALKGGVIVVELAKVFYPVLQVRQYPVKDCLTRGIGGWRLRSIVDCDIVVVVVVAQLDLK